MPSVAPPVTPGIFQGKLRISSRVDLLNRPFEGGWVGSEIPLKWPLKIHRIGGPAQVKKNFLLQICYKKCFHVY